MRHLRAWDGRREIYWVIICSMGLTHIPGVVLAGISMKEMYRTYLPASLALLASSHRF